MLPNHSIVTPKSSLLGTVGHWVASKVFEGVALSVRWVSIGITALLLLTSAGTNFQVFAQKDPKKEQNAKEPDNLDFWLTRDRVHVGAAVEMVLAQNPITVAAQRIEAKRWSVWDEPEIETAPPLDPLNQWALVIRDKTPMPDLRGKAPDEIGKSQRAARDAWVQAIINASITPVDAFKKSAEDNTHVTFAQLYNDPAKYRFSVVKLEGRMARLRKFDSVPGAALDAGITHYYEGYVYGPTAHSNPFFVQFLTLPEGLKEAEKMDRYVTFYGYFFKLTRYKDGQQRDKDTPLLIGPTVILTRTPVAEDVERKSLSEQAVYGLVGFGVFMIVLLTGLSWWFRRGDRQFRNRVADIHVRSAQEAMESAEQGLPLAPDLPHEETLKPAAETLPSIPGSVHASVRAADLHARSSQEAIRSAEPAKPLAHDLPREEKLKPAAEALPSSVNEENLKTADEPPPTSPGSASASVRTVDGREIVAWTCPSCQKQVEVNLDLGQKTVHCPACGRAVEVPAVRGI